MEQRGFEESRDGQLQRMLKASLDTPELSN